MFLPQRRDGSIDSYLYLLETFRPFPSSAYLPSSGETFFFFSSVPHGYSCIALLTHGSWQEGDAAGLVQVDALSLNSDEVSPEMGRKLASECGRPRSQAASFSEGFRPPGGDCVHRKAGESWRGKRTLKQEVRSTETQQEGHTLHADLIPRPSPRGAIWPIEAWWQRPNDSGARADLRCACGEASSPDAANTVDLVDALHAPGRWGRRLSTNRWAPGSLQSLMRRR